MFKILIFLLVKICSGNNIDVDWTTVSVANAIADKYQTGCTVLLQPDNATWEENRRTFSVAKLLSKTYDFSKTLRVATFQQYMDHVSYRYNVNRCSKMLHIVYGFDRNIKSQMEKV